LTFNFVTVADKQLFFFKEIVQLLKNKDKIVNACTNKNQDLKKEL